MVNLEPGNDQPTDPEGNSVAAKKPKRGKHAITHLYETTAMELILYNLLDFQRQFLIGRIEKLVLHEVQIHVPKNVVKVYCEVACPSQDNHTVVDLEQSAHSVSQQFG